MFLPQQKKGSKGDSDDDEDEVDGDMDDIMALAAQGKPAGQMQAKRGMSAFQMLDVEEPDLSDVSLFCCDWELNPGPPECESSMMPLRQRV